MEDTRITKIRDIIRDVPDYPKEGIVFKDITTLLQDSEHFIMAVDLLCEAVEKLSFDAIAAIESRGFIFGSVLAYKLGVSFIPIAVGSSELRSQLISKSRYGLFFKNLIKF